MSPAALTVLTVLVGIAVLTAAVTALRHPVLRRLAVRSVRRRPAETALVTLGALLGTAIIVGSLTVGDTLTSSLRSDAFTQLGPVDEEVTAPGAGSLTPLDRALAGMEGSPAIDGVVTGLRGTGTAAARLDASEPAVQPDTQLLELDFDGARQLGDEPAATGLAEATTPSPGEAAVSADLADALGLQEGDELTVFAYGASPQLRVTAVLPRRGVAGYNTDLDAHSFNVFLTPGTLEQLVPSPQHQASPPVAFGLVSNAGGVLDGVDHTDQVTALLDEHLAGLPATEVSARKEQLLDTAEAIGDQLSEVFLGLGAFAVIAGVLLLVNVFVMLAQERRGELGLMRAVGMRRGQLVRAFFLEGGFYAVAAAALGAGAGVGVGAAVVALVKGMAGGGPAGFTLELAFAAEPASVAGGFLVGLTISLATILVTSVRVSRLTVIHAIRGLPEPARNGRRMTVVAVGGLAAVVGLGLSATAFPAQAGVGMLVGPALLAGGLAALAGQLVPASLPVTLAGLAVTAWGVSAPTLLPEAFRGSDVAVFVVQGVVVTAAAVAVLAANQDTVGRLVGRAAGGAGSVPARLGLAYPLARPFRTTMTLSMYALVVFTLVLISLVSQVFGGHVDAFTKAESGGYHLLVDSARTQPLPPDRIRERDDVEGVAALRYAAYQVEFRAPGRRRFRRWFASGFDEAFLDRQPPTLARWLPRLPDEQAAWEHVLAEPDAMIVGSRFLQEGGAPQPVEVGDTVEIRDPLTGTVARRTIAGVMEGGTAFSGAFLSEDSFEAVFSDRLPPNRFYVALTEQADPEEVAGSLERDHIANGVQAQSFEAVVAERQQQNRQFMRLLQGYLMLGLLVGITGLGVIMVRAVRERRREIGMLRSLGLQPATVGWSFMLQAGFVALQGILIGTALATATGYQLVTNASALGGIDADFAVPWVELTTLVGLTLAASLLAAGWPARQASRIRPALALRTTE